MEKTLFILGAGFTKAFIPDAPLLVDNSHLGDGDLEKKYSKECHRYAADILQYERTQGVNIERLMTRLHTFMPHDYERKCTQELELLYHDLKDLFVNRLRKLTTDKQTLPEDLTTFARWCIENEADCISFNYDDFLDRALFAHYAERDEPVVGHKYWHPNSGYGFFCRPAYTCIRNHNIFMRSSSMLLLKLHGSINWRIMLGAPDPYQIDSIVHEQDWYPPPVSDVDLWSRIDRKMVEKHLNPTSFIVLPVLHKTDLEKEPLFRRIWAEAFERLKKANRVIFIGYSMPRTDIATGFLLGEALRENCSIQVVSIDTDKPRNTLISAFQEVLPHLSENQFDFTGAVPWLKRNRFL